jgi:hypothetical protein
MSAEPTILITDNKEPTTSNQGTAAAVDTNSTGKGNNAQGLDALMEIHLRKAGQPLSMAGLKDVQTLADIHGVDVVLQVYERWLAGRDVSGLKCPLTMFAREFSGTLAAAQASEKRTADRAANERFVDEYAEQERRKLDERFAAARAEEQRQRTTHYPDDPLCDCERCLPDYWASKRVEEPAEVN